jgi:hypothetical protein
VAICTPARALAERRRCRRRKQHPARAGVEGGVGRAGLVRVGVGSATGHRRNLLQPQHENRQHQAGDAEDEVAPAGRLQPGQVEADRGERDRGDQVADEGGRLGRAGAGRRGRRPRPRPAPRPARRGRAWPADRRCWAPVERARSRNQTASTRATTIVATTGDRSPGTAY